MTRQATRTVFVALVLLALGAAPAWAAAPSGGTLVIASSGKLSHPSGGTREYTAPGFVKWKSAASETPGIGCCTYRVYNYLTGALVTTTGATSFPVTLSSVSILGFRVDAFDAAATYLGSTYAPPPDTSVDFYADDDTCGACWAYTGSWRFANSGGAWQSTYHFSSTAGDTAWYGPAWGSSFGLVVTKGPNFGAFDVYLDDHFVKTVDSYTPTVSQRRIVLTLSPNRAGFSAPHEIRVVNRATPGRPTIRVDAITVLASPQ